MKLMEAIEINPAESLHKNKVAKKIGMENLLPFYKFVNSFELKKYAGGSKFKNGDTIVARITPCLENGKTAFIDLLEEGEIAFGSTEFIVMRGKKNITINEYVYYLCISPWFRKKAISLMSGTSGRQRVQIEPLRLVEVFIPPISTQKKIVKILSNIDKKIRINNQINNNLYEIGKAIYQEYFAYRNIPYNEFYGFCAAPKSTQASAPFGLDFLCHTRSCVCCVFSILNSFPTWGRPSTDLLFPFHQYHAPTLTGIKYGYTGFIRLSRATACNGLFHTFPAFHVPTILS